MSTELTRLRVPTAFNEPSQLLPCADQQESDLQSVLEIIAGLDRLEATLNNSPIPQAVAQRGYFTPDEDDRVRQGLLSYRNHRLAAYEVIVRYRDYGTIEPWDAQAAAFLLAFGAALVLYSKSLKIVAITERAPLLRAKLNEPDAKFELAEGFFDDVVAGYSSFANLRSLKAAASFWRSNRRPLATFAKARGGQWPWLIDRIALERRVLRNRVLEVLVRRLRYDWRALWKMVHIPFRAARRRVENLVGGLADIRVDSNPTHAVGSELLGAFSKLLRPGDILLMRTDNRVTTTIVPGFWTHAALFLGTFDDLQTMGLTANQALTKHWEHLHQNGPKADLVIEAVFPAVQVSLLSKCLSVDHVLAFRPVLPISELTVALGEALGHLGKPYDLDFDFNNSSRLVCTELVYRCFHGRGGIDFPLSKRLGRFTLIGDDIVAQALASQTPTQPSSCLTPIALILKQRDGKAHWADSQRISPLLRRLDRGWRPTRRVKVSG